MPATRYPAEMNAPEQAAARDWVSRWKPAGDALERVRIEELRALSSDNSARAFANLAFDSETVWLTPNRQNAAGLIEQQRLFRKSNEHPARHQRRG